MEPGRMAIRYGDSLCLSIFVLIELIYGMVKKNKEKRAKEKEKSLFCPSLYTKIQVTSVG